MRLSLIVCLIVLAPVALAIDGEKEFVSSVKSIPLLELYTSEGCSSCPPAEEWFSTLTKSPLLWREIVPVAFHVDYWNYLGWIDPYSSPEASARQHDYAQEWRTGSVYTPEFVLNGHEWRIGEAIRSGGNIGVMKLRVSKPGSLDATFTTSEKAEGLLLHVVPMTCGIRQVISGGENRGRTLMHDFVALGIFQSPLNSNANGTVTAHLIIPTELFSKSRAIAAWISCGQSPSPLQAVGGWIK